MGGRVPEVVVAARVAAARDALVAAIEGLIVALAAQREEPAALLSASEAGAVLGVHHSKVHQLVRDGFLSRIEGFTELRVSREQVLAYARGEISSAAQVRPLRAVQA